MDGGDLHRENWHRCNRTCHSLMRGSHAGHWLWREGEREGVCLCVHTCLLYMAGVSGVCSSPCWPQPLWSQKQEAWHYPASEGERE